MGSHLWAKEDGVEYIWKEFGRGYYLPPCVICGRKVRTTQYSRKRVYKCDYCKGVIKEKRKEEIRISDVRTKYDKRFDGAVDAMRRQLKNLDKYTKAIDIARTACYRYGSIPEAMVAIELLHNKLAFVPQQKVGKYKVDFAIPSIRVILEVDGELYHCNIEKEALRDFTISKMMPEWKIIHVPAEIITGNIKGLMKIIKGHVSIRTK